MKEIIFSYFADITPPSVNIRLGRGKFGNIYKNSEYKAYAESILSRLRTFLGREKNLIPKKHLYAIELFFLGDWYDSVTLMTRGYSLKYAVGCCGNDKPDLDNLFKVCIDAIKEYVQNDDRFVTEVHGYKVIWPQATGVILQVRKGEALELPQILPLIPEEIYKEIRKL